MPPRTVAKRSVGSVLEQASTSVLGNPGVGGCPGTTNLSICGAVPEPITLVDVPLRGVGIPITRAIVTLCLNSNGIKMKGILKIKRHCLSKRYGSFVVLS